MTTTTPALVLDLGGQPWDLGRNPHALIIGAGRSGKTTTAAAAAQARRAGLKTTALGPDDVTALDALSAGLHLQRGAVPQHLVVIDDADLLNRRDRRSAAVVETLVRLGHLGGGHLLLTAQSGPATFSGAALVNLLPVDLSERPAS